MDHGHAHAPSWIAQLVATQPYPSSSTFANTTGSCGHRGRGICCHARPCPIQWHTHAQAHAHARPHFWTCLQTRARIQNPHAHAEHVRAVHAMHLHSPGWIPLAQKPTGHRLPNRSRNHGCLMIVCAEVENGHHVEMEVRVAPFKGACRHRSKRSFSPFQVVRSRRRSSPACGQAFRGWANTRT